MAFSIASEAMTARQKKKKKIEIFFGSGKIQNIAMNLKRFINSSVLWCLFSLSKKKKKKKKMVYVLEVFKVAFSRML